MFLFKKNRRKEKSALWEDSARMCLYLDMEACGCACVASVTFYFLFCFSETVSLNLELTGSSTLSDPGSQALGDSHVGPHVC